MNDKMFTKAFWFVVFFVCSMTFVGSVFARGTSDRNMVKTYIADEAKNYSASIDISDYDIKSEEITSIMNEIFNEYPELFFVKDKYNYFYDSNGKVVSIEVDYIDTKENIEKMKEEFDEEVGKVYDMIKPNMTDEQKLLVVHDYLALSTEYDYDNYIKKDIPFNSYTAYGALIDKKAVCLGYARAYKYIINRLGIECEIVVSYKMNHAWNIVNIQGQYFNIDVTKDDVVYDTLGYVSHRKFLLSDNAMLREGYNMDDTRYKALNTKYDNYFWKNINSAILNYKDRWYYTNSSKIFAYDFDRHVSSELADLSNEKWYVNGSTNYYASSYNKIVVSGDKLLVNTSTKIYEIGFNDEIVEKNGIASKTNIKKIYDIQNKNMSIYGICFLNNDLYCHMKQSPSSEGIKVKTGISKINDVNIASGDARSAIDISDNDDILKESANKDDELKDDILTDNKDIKDILKNDNKKNSLDDVENTSSLHNDNDNNDNSVNEIVDLSAQSVCIQKGAKVKLEVFKDKRINNKKDAIWSSSNDSIVRVDQNGYVSAVSEGIAIVNCKVDNVIKECVIKVKIFKIHNIRNYVKIDYENQSRKRKWYMSKMPRVMVKKTCFRKKAAKTGKGYKIERICKRVLKRTIGSY